MSIPIPSNVTSGSIITSDINKRTLRQRIMDNRWIYVFMLPSLILTAMFTLYPIIASAYYSFFQWSGFTSAPYYIGIANYQEVIGDAQFWNAFKNSFVFMLTSVPIKLTLALIIAIVLNDRALRLAPIFRTMFFVPVVTTTAIVGIVMTFILSPFNGPINLALMDLGLVNRPIDFLGDPKVSLFAVVGVEIWKWLGNPMIYWLAALQTIPETLYEAAEVDGANWWRKFFFITLPLIRPFAVVILLITAVGTLNVFALVQTMTQGGPFFASEVMEVYIYRTAFGAANSMTLPRIGYASAAAVFFGLAVMVIAILQFVAARWANREKAGIAAAETTREDI
ncbi:sugar ABC transporter permease [Phototrophicus methaneseepsis]|uniref:Sugar ABC transporter permease n=1 Tax=Phototrophicus methaneseepsis TaxID=2710758 RepID=A0A7S8EBP0_9CHLR|nr:sugar ABC transporter permease [Phototrophicus methaneseepsis]QPC84022.1 sugar ABC transporter permease [Phototrophicus methaneseepsis]